MHEADPPTPRLTRSEILAWRNGVFAVFAMCGLGLGSWMARTPAVKDTLDISTGEMGVLIFGIAAGSVFGLLLSSPLIDRFGAKAVLAFCMVAESVGLVIAGFGVSFGAVFWVVAAGLASVPLVVQAAALGVVMIVVGDWGALATRSERVLPERNGDAEGAAPNGWRSRLEIWKDPRTILLGLIVLGMAFAEGSASDWLALASVESHGTQKATGALIFGVFVAAMTVGRLAGPRILDRYGRVPVLRASAGVAAFGLLVFIFVPVLWVAIIGVALWGLGSALGFPTGMSAAADDPETAAARVNAVAMIGYAAFLVGPPAIGFLGQSVGLLHALLLVLVLIVVAGFASGAARERTSTD